MPSKTPPLSIRPGDVRLAKIAGYATKHGLNRHAAVLELIDLALNGLTAVATSRPTPKPVPGSDAAKRKRAPASITYASLAALPNPEAQAFAADIESRVAASVPLHQPKAFNPQPKKGKKK